MNIQNTRVWSCMCEEEQSSGYLGHPGSVLEAVQGGGVHGLIGDKIRALDLINGFDFGNGG